MKTFLPVLAACLVGATVGVVGGVARRAGPAAGAAAPADRPDPLDPDDAALARQAMACLLRIQSVLDAGVNLMEYSERVLDTKVEVDAALRRMGPGPVRAELADAIGAYVAARDFWRSCIQHAKRPGDEFVPLPASELETYKKYGVTPMSDGMVWRKNVHEFWRYASRLTGEIREQLVD